MSFNPYADLDQQRQREVAHNGTTANDLARTAHDVLHRVLNRPAPHWQSIAELDQIPWQEVAAKALSIMDLPENEQADFQVNAKQLAQALYNVYTAARCLPPDFSAVHTAERMAWEAVGRHLANIIEADKGAANVADLENRIVEWAKQRLSHLL